MRMYAEVAALEEPSALPGGPDALRADNGPEFLATALTDWAEQHGVPLDFIQPGQPAQNAFIGCFYQTYRTEILDANVFSPIHEVRAISDDWRRRYNLEGRTSASAACRP